MGQIKLPMTLEEEPRQAFKYCTFMVVGFPSAYNAILGRPALVEFRVVTSIRHLCLKIPTESGIGTVRGNHKEVRKCYNVSLQQPVMVVKTRDHEQSLPNSVEVVTVLAEEADELDPRVQEERVVEPMEEVEELALDAATPDRRTKIGKNLEEKVQNLLLTFL
ncbi:uncharacterized protein LOC133799984 [Humulus lupulus]|uniref:uncharacterized protein LOC133799984 n=1 Tax=Humulus lupulus TaxID=3486 RepID=UPI002B4087A5|nr:uncharacterized protein LOC133799984 [Humulus lupulus]